MHDSISIAAIVTVSTAIFSILVKVIGLPDQIKSNHRRRSTEGLSGWLVICTFLSYVLWTIHGFFEHDISLIVGQGLGVLTTTVILWQVIIYRKPTPQKESSRIALQRLTMLIPGKRRI